MGYSKTSIADTLAKFHAATPPGDVRMLCSEEQLEKLRELGVDGTFTAPETGLYEIGGRVDDNEALEEFRKAEKIADEKSVSPATKEEQTYLERFPEDRHEYELEKLRLERFEKKLAKVQHAATKKKSKFTKSNKKESKNLKSARKKSKKQNRR